jgi:hypothetical protein
MLMHRSENVIPEVFRRRFDEHEPIISHSSNLIPLTEMGGQNTPAATWQVKKGKEWTGYRRLREATPLPRTQMVEAVRAPPTPRH